MKTICWNISTRHRYQSRTPLPEMPEIPRQAVLVIGGDAPAWRYCQALKKASGILHGMGASVLAVFDPSLGAVVIDSHSPRYRPGDTITMQWPDTADAGKRETKKDPIPIKVIEKPPSDQQSPRNFRTKLRTIKGKYLYSNIKESRKVKTWMDKTGYFKLPDEDQE